MYFVGRRRLIRGINTSFDDLHMCSFLALVCVLLQIHVGLYLAALTVLSYTLVALGLTCHIVFIACYAAL